MAKRAVVLGGGASRGAYQIGVWKALKELELEYQIVAGTSVGALNGAMMVQGRYEPALDMWENLHTADVLDFPDGLDESRLTPELWRVLFGKIRGGGADPAPLEAILRRVIDEDAVRRSPVAFGFVTVEKLPPKPLALTKDEVPQGKLCDYLMASAACFPTMKPRRIDGKEYIDGAYYSNVPVELACKMGAEELIAVDLEAIGITRTTKGEGHVRAIRCYWDLGPTILFYPETAKRNIRLGYLDTLKSFGVLDGVAYAFEKWELSHFLKEFRFWEGQGFAGFPINPMARARLNSTLAHRRYSRDSFGEKQAVWALLELTGEELELSPLNIYTAHRFVIQILEAYTRLEQQWQAGDRIQPEKVLEAGGRFRRYLKRGDRQALMVSILHLMEKGAPLDMNADFPALLIAALPRECAAAYCLFVLKGWGKRLGF